MVSVSADISLFIMTKLHMKKDTTQSICKNLNSYNVLILRYCTVFSNENKIWSNKITKRLQNPRNTFKHLMNTKSTVNMQKYIN